MNEDRQGIAGMDGFQQPIPYPTPTPTDIVSQSVRIPCDILWVS